MPSYEVNFLLRRMTKPEIVTVMKQIGEAILNNGGVLRKLEFLGHRPLPWKMVNQSAPKSKSLTQGSYFLYHCDVPSDISTQLAHDLQMDPEIMQIRFVRKEPKLPEGYKCTLDDEFKIPAFRESVQQLIKEGRKQPGPPPMKYPPPTNWDAI